MTPSNPDNNQPLIYRICDAAGVFHIVAPVNHTHTYADVPGLADDLSELWAGLNEKANQEDMTEALAGKQNVLTFDSAPTAGSTNPVTSGGVKAALDGKQDALTFDNTPTANSTNPVTSGGIKTALDGKATYYVIESREYPEDGYSQVTTDNDAELGGNIVITVRKGNGPTKTLHIHSDNIENIERALLNPDSTPTAESDNLVTSGGVKAALDCKAPLLDTQVVFLTLDNTGTIYLPYYFQNGVNQRTLLINFEGSEVDILDMFVSDQSDKSDIRILTANDTPEFSVSDCYLSVRVIRQPNGISTGIDAYYIIIDGILTY